MNDENRASNVPQKLLEQLLEIAETVRCSLSQMGDSMGYNAEGLCRVQLACTEVHASSNGTEQSNAIQLFGCYLGETILRHYGGTWVEAPEQFTVKIAIALPNGVIVNPFGKASNVIGYGDESIVDYFDNMCLMSNIDPNAMSRSVSGSPTE
jgi:hypothetical protein